MYFSTLPSGFSLTLNTHLQPIACLFGGKSNRVQELFLYKVKNSFVVTSFWYGCLRASIIVLGSLLAMNTHGLNTLALDRVVIGCVFRLWSMEEVVEGTMLQPRGLGLGIRGSWLWDETNDSEGETGFWEVESNSGEDWIQGIKPEELGRTLWKWDMLTGMSECLE